MTEFDAAYMRMADQFSRGPQWRKDMAEVVRIVRQQVPSKVLDFGCNTGRLAIQLTHRTAAHVHGIDVNKNAIVEAKAHCTAHLSFHFYEEGKALPFWDGMFDMVTCCYVLSHIGNPTSALDQIYKVLRPGGQLIVVVPNQAFDRLMIPWNFVTRYKPDATIKHYWSMETLCLHLRSLAFHIIDR